MRFLLFPTTVQHDRSSSSPPDTITPADLSKYSTFRGSSRFSTRTSTLQGNNVSSWASWPLAQHSEVLYNANLSPFCKKYLEFRSSLSRRTLCANENILYLNCLWLVACTEHLKCSYCDWGTDFLYFTQLQMNLNLKSHIWLVTYHRQHKSRARVLLFLPEMIYFIS